MQTNTLLSATLGILLQLPPVALAGGEPPSAEEMWRTIQSQQREIELLQQKLGATERKAEAAAEAVDQAQYSVSTQASWAEKTQIGGYGELHYNNLNGSNGAKDKDEIDFHRFVLFFGHQFSDRLRLFSELEVEHALTGDNNDGSGSKFPGEVALEQAYLEYDATDRLSAKGGLFLLPVGILNETHEPPTFYGVERNPVEKNIVPTTWSVGGVGLSGEITPGLSFDVAIHEGLKTSAADGFKPRDGRQKTAEATADDLAATARLKWTGIPGVELAGSIQYQNDITQGTDSSAGSATLYEVHGVLQRGPIGLRALYARWDLDGSGPKAIGADEQTGYYIEPSYRINDRLGVFVRYNQWDNAAGSSGSEKQQWDAGLNWWPHPDVVVKADYQDQDFDGGNEQDGFNLGVGYQF